jgi:hypothetical protein
MRPRSPLTVFDHLQTLVNNVTDGLYRNIQFSSRELMIVASLLAEDLSLPLIANVIVERRIVRSAGQW